VKRSDSRFLTWRSSLLLRAVLHFSLALRLLLPSSSLRLHHSPLLLSFLLSFLKSLPFLPSFPVQALGPHGINMMEFCKQFNANTTNFESATPLRVVINPPPTATIYPVHRCLDPEALFSQPVCCNVFAAYSFISSSAPPAASTD
jgi:hypothetical protein